VYKEAKYFVQLWYCLFEIKDIFYVFIFYS
jgi:hypothetical protein